MSPAVSAALAALVVLWGVPTAPRSGRRPVGRSGESRQSGGRLSGRFASLGVPVLVGVAIALLVGGAAGAVAGIVGAGLARVVLGRLEPADRRRHREALERQAPLVVDLVAACLASGASLERSLDVASAAVGAPAADLLSRATASLRLGADPRVVWADLARHDPLAPMARAVARSQQTGAPVSALLPRVADQARAAHRARAEARIRTAAVRLTAPLGVAFLPAFVLLGVVPVVASWVGRLL